MGHHHDDEQPEPVEPNHLAQDGMASFNELHETLHELDREAKEGRIGDPEQVPFEQTEAVLEKAGDILREEGVREPTSHELDMLQGTPGVIVIEGLSTEGQNLVYWLTLVGRNPAAWDVVEANTHRLANLLREGLYSGRPGRHSREGRNGRPT